MLRRLRENGPVVLVPLAWTFVTAAHADLVATRPLLIAHLVMDTLLVTFAALSWSDMTTGVLRVWRTVIVVGLGLTLAGTAGLLATPMVDPLLALAVVGWMLLPAAGLAYTGRAVTEWPRVYLVGAGLSALGAVVYVAAPLLPGGAPATLVGLTLVNVGQTAGIVAAVLAY